VLGIREIAPRVRGLGGIVGVAHPFVPGDPLCTGCRQPDDIDPRTFDLMEVWYRAWDSPGSDNEAAYALWNRFWTEGARVTAVAARDWHGPEQEGPFPGRLPLTGVWAEDDTASAIVAGLRSGRVIMSGGPILDLFARGADGEVAQIGGTIARGPSPATLVTEVQRLDGPAELRVFRSGERILTTELAADGVVELAGLAEEPGFYRAELWQSQLPRAITNHVLVA
jgi:hypothetical protein